MLGLIPVSSSGGFSLISCIRSFGQVTAQVGLLMLFAATADATSYSSLIVPQNTSVSIGSPNLSLAMQPDGNLVLYQSGAALWSDPKRPEDQSDPTWCSIPVRGSPESIGGNCLRTER